MTTISTDDIRAHYAGHGHWFNVRSMRFFHSRISQDAYLTADKFAAFFVTSEQCDWKSPRLYTVRRYDFASHNISTVGKFQAYTSRKSAHTAARRACLRAILRAPLGPAPQHDLHGPIPIPA